MNQFNTASTEEITTDGGSRGGIGGLTECRRGKTSFLNSPRVYGVKLAVRTGYSGSSVMNVSGLKMTNLPSSVNLLRFVEDCTVSSPFIESISQEMLANVWTNVGLYVRATFSRRGHISLHPFNLLII